MEENKYTELAKLKELLDSGVLTQDEFERAKKRILESGEPVAGSGSAPQAARANTLLKYKWYGAVGLAILVVIATISVKSCNGKALDADAESDSIIYAPEVPLNMDDFPEEVEIDMETANQWKKHYFRDKWGDEDHNRPFISTLIGGNRVNLGVLFCKDRFTFKLFDDDGDVREIFSSKVNLSFKCRGEEFNNDTPLVVDKNEIHLGGEEDLSFLSTLFNIGDFQICLDYESYNEHYHYVWTVNHAPGTFKYAVENLLGSTYCGNSQGGSGNSANTWTKQNDQDGAHIAMRIDNPDQGILEIAYSKRFGFRLSAYDHNDRQIVIEKPVLVEIEAGEQAVAIDPDKVEDCRVYMSYSEAVKFFGECLNDGPTTNICIAMNLGDDWIRYEWPVRTKKGEFGRAKENL